MSSTTYASIILTVLIQSYFPHIKTVHTSSLFHGQVYMPLANWLLMVGTVIVTAVYSNVSYFMLFFRMIDDAKVFQTTRLGLAYGVCVISVTFITTCLVSLVAIIKWRFNILIILFVLLVFSCLDGVYLSSALIKVPDGAWFTLLLAAILSSIFVLWRFGKEQQWTSEGEDRLQPADILEASDETLKLTTAFGGAQVSRVAGMGIFFDKIGDKVPVVFTQFVRKFSAMPELLVFFHMRQLSTPSIPEAERYIITRTSIPCCYRLTIRHGYVDHIVTPDLGRLIKEQLVLFITRDTASTPGNASSKEHSPEVQAELDAIDRAQKSQMVYVMGKEQMHIRKSSNSFRKAVLWCFLWMRENSRAKMADLNLPYDELVEVGFVKEI